MADGQPERARRTFGPVVLVGLAAAAIAAVAAGRPWGSADQLVGTVRREVHATGTDVAPQALALALVALAAWGAILVLRRRGRRIMALLGAAAALGVAASVAESGRRVADVTLRLAGDPDTAEHMMSAWYAVCLVAALLTAGTFVAAWWLAPAWPEMGSRYDAPGTTPRPREAQDLWKAMDEGEDPTTWSGH